MTTNIALNQPAYNSTVPTWDQPLNNNATILDKVFGNTTSVSVNTGSTTTYTLITAPNSAGTGSTSQCMRFNLTGNLAADQYVLLPTGVSGMWIVTNATTGSFAVNIASNDGTNIPAGTAVSVPQGYSTLVYSDSVNVKKADDGTTANPGVTSFSGGTTGLTPSAISTGAITLGGTLIAANGGTGLTSPGPSGNVLTSNGTAWVSQAAAAAGVSSFSTGTTGLSVNSSTGAVTLSGTLGVANGGTGQTTYTNGQLLIGNTTGNTLTKATLTAGTGISITNGAGSITISTTGGSGTVTSVGLSAPAMFSVTGSPVTSSGTLTLSYSGSALPVANGGTGQTTYTNGELLIGNTTGNTLTKATLTAGTGISITNGAGSITISTTGGSGTVTSVGLSAPALFTVSGSPVTSSGTLTLSYSGSALPVANGGTGQTTYTNGQLLIGNTTGSTLTKATLTAGSGVSITNGAGSITVGMSGSYTGTFTASTGLVATTGDVKSTAGKVIAGNNGHYLNSSGTGTATTRIWQVSTIASGDATDTSIYWDNSAAKYFFNPSGVNGCLTLTSTQFDCYITPRANQTSWTLISDRSVKKDIEPVANAAQRIMSLNPVNFTWIETEKRDAGFIAQDFETVYPKNVQTLENGKKAIAINMNIYADLVSTIQTLMNKIDSLEARLTAHNL